MRMDPLDELRAENPLPELLPGLPLEVIRQRLDDEPWLLHARDRRAQFETTRANHETFTPTNPRRRLLGLCAAGASGLALAGVIIGLTLSTTLPPSAYADAEKALAATAGAASGTMIMTVGQGSTALRLNITRWNGNRIAISSVQHLLGPNRQLLLIGSGAYLQLASGAWRHYAKASTLGQLENVVELARHNVTGSTAEQILGLATGLHKYVQPDGTTLYTGTIPTTNAYPAYPPEDEIMRMITTLRSPQEPGAARRHPRHLQFKMLVRPDGLVTRVSLTLHEHDTSPTTMSITYSRLGRTAPITAPAHFAQATGSPSRSH